MKAKPAKKPAKPAKAIKPRMNQKDLTPSVKEAKQAVNGLSSLILILLTARLKASSVDSDNVVLPDDVVDHVLTVIVSLSSQIQAQFDL
jgi:hypothetical protein